MARFVFKLPDVGEGTTEAEIIKWHVAPGGSVKEDEPLVDVATDKAVVEIPAPVSGTVISIHGAAGDMVPVGTELIVLETAEVATPSATVSPIRPEKELAIEPASSNVVALASAVADEKPVASPAVRRRARELDIELRKVKGSGPGGRISHADLDAYVARKPGPAAVPAAGAGEDVADVEEIKLIGVRRRIAERMQEAKRRIPHFSYVEEIDMTALEELRGHLNEKHAGTRPKLTLLPFLVRAIVRSLATHPEMNARFDDDKGVVSRHKAVHMGIATQTPNGLLVPVLRNAGQRDPWDCASEIMRLAKAARDGKATSAELAGSTITVSSLGALGGIASTPIINYPEVAIVGVNKLIERPVVLPGVGSGQIVVRSMMNLSASFDHRVVDGWNAAAFIQDVKQLLEQPATLFID